MRHLIKSFRRFPITIFTDHAATVEIVKQIFLTTASIEKLNLRLIKTFQYLSALPIKIKIKLGKFHLILDALSRLKSNSESDSESTASALNDLDVEVMFAEIHHFRQIFLKDVTFYRIKKILDVH